MPDIVLSTLNARYIHSSLGLRYLYANLGELKPRACIKEYVINTRAIEIVEDLLGYNPKIIGFGVYIWNVMQTEEVVSLLKLLRPEIIIILGGPEVSFEFELQTIVRTADYTITGQADLQFAKLCTELLSQKASPHKILHAPIPKLDALTLPYSDYTDEDIAHRVIYVEASRGCPFKCEFCLSALDKTALPFDIHTFLREMHSLYERGARHFKFVDRTFNLKIDISIQIMQFFLQKQDDNLFLHFELIPDHLPDRLKSVIKHFPAGALQFEIGIQSFNPDVQSLISRKQNNQKCYDNITWLRTESTAHLHTDLIVGLPGESMQSFAQGFNTLVALRPHEIQVGILKRLRGTPIIRHTNTYAIRYNTYPPYNILQSTDIDFTTMQRMSRFARYWDLIANSGRFSNTLPILMGNNPFDRFMQLSDWIYQTTGQTHKIALAKLFSFLFEALTTVFDEDKHKIIGLLQADFKHSGLKGIPAFLRQDLHRDEIKHRKKPGKPAPAASRQARHLP